jgi:LPPG:FO 2-phospho-L-lactate transferase
VALNITAFAGGVGGAKMVDGLAALLPDENLRVVVNTGDDFKHFGLTICPDVDTIMYTLAGVSNPLTGWGRAEESWRVLETVEQLGGPTWFQLGDQDLALHLERTRLLQSGEPLSAVCARLCAQLGTAVQVLPMSDDPVWTMVLTDEGELPFQEYFVARHCEPKVSSFQFRGVEKARPAPGVLEAIQQADCIVFCPSNPWVSLDPILAVPGLRVAAAEKPVIGVSPIVGGQAIKGPAAKMYTELGYQPSALTVAKHYADLLTAFVIDNEDAELQSQISDLGMLAFATNIVMQNQNDRRRLAEEVLEYVLKEVLMVVKS